MLDDVFGKYTGWFSHVRDGNCLIFQLVTDPKVTEIADQIRKTPAQVLLRWAVQQNIGE